MGTTPFAVGRLVGRGVGVSVVSQVLAPVLGAKAPDAQLVQTDDPELDV